MVRRKTEKEDDAEDAGSTDTSRKAIYQVHQQNELDRKLEKMNAQLDVTDKLEKPPDGKKRETRAKQPSLLPVILRCFGGEYIIAGLLKLVSVIIDFIKPPILRYIFLKTTLVVCQFVT